jgi:hypothetical protein
MRREELEALTRPFVEEYLPDHFGGGTDLSTWYTTLDRMVEDAVHNGPNAFGDVLLSLDVAAPAAALAAWVRPRSKAETTAAAAAVSRAIQRAVRRLLPFHYFQDVSNLRQDASAASLLVWSALPVTTAVTVARGSVTLDRGPGLYWNFPDPALRTIMATHPATTARLVPALLSAAARLQEAGDTANARFFVPSETPDFQNLAAVSRQFEGLCFFEAEVVEKAADALADLARFTTAAATHPAAAIERLASFGADLTAAFHARISSLYGNASLRSLGPAILLEASRALDPSLRGVRPTASLRLSVLRPGRAFRPQDFLAGREPEAADVVLGQRLVSA